MIDCYSRCCQGNEPKNTEPCIPNLEGKWDTFGTIFTRKNNTEVPDFNNIKTILFKQEIQQNGNFLIIKEDVRTRLGVLTFINSVWTLKIADDDDNGTQTLVPKVRGNYTYWVGNYTEPGFDNRLQQSQTVGKVDMIKENCNCCCKNKST